MGLARALERARAALTAASTEELLGTEQLWGNFFIFDDALSLGFWDVHSVAPIVFRGAANSPADDTMG